MASNSHQHDKPITTSRELARGNEMKVEGYGF
jgi:hypothetical protein